MSIIFLHLLCRENAWLLFLWWQRSLGPQDGSPSGLQFDIRYNLRKSLFYWQCQSLRFYLLCEVWSAEPRISPSSVISRCSPGLTAYRCLSRTTCPQSWTTWGPWSSKGKEKTPAHRNRFAKVMATIISKNMIQILLQTVCTNLRQLFAVILSLSRTVVFNVVLISCWWPFPKVLRSKSRHTPTLHPTHTSPDHTVDIAFISTVLFLF